MTTITVYDPPMCCSTGICGPEIDPKLTRFAGDLDWLKSCGVEVRRFNPAQEPGRFVENAAVKALLDRSGGDDLPAILVGDELVATAHYPGRDVLAAMVGLADHMPGAEAPKATVSSCCGGSKAGQEKLQAAVDRRPRPTRSAYRDVQESFKIRLFYRQGRRRQDLARLCDGAEPRR